MYYDNEISFLNITKENTNLYKIAHLKLCIEKYSKGTKPIYLEVPLIGEM